MVPTKRVIMTTAIIAVIGLALMWLIIGLIMHAPQWVLVTIVLIAIVVGTIGALIGWLILRKIYPQLRSTGEKPEKRVKRDETHSRQDKKF
jgi:uncharacterized membrane protein YciS (DUF1049 family)